MARSLSTPLTNAVNATTRRPAVSLIAQDHIHHLPNTLSTSGNTENKHSACIADDGSIIRVHVTWGGTSLNQNFRWQRITDPTDVTQWETWTTFGGGSGNMWRDGHCAVSNNNGTLRAFAQRGTGGNNLYVWQSTDNGQTWSGSPSTVLNPPSSGLLNGIASAGNNDVFMLYDVLGGVALGCSLYNGSSWSALIIATLLGRPVGNGLAAAWDGTHFHIFYSDNTSIFHATANSTATVWNSLPNIIQSGGNALNHYAPHISHINGYYYLTSIEASGSVLTGVDYSCPKVRKSSDLYHWSSGTLYPDLDNLRGATLLACTPPAASREHIILSSMLDIRYGYTLTESDPDQHLDLSSNILAYTRTEQANQPATITITLDNNQSTLTSSITNGTDYKPIGIDTTLLLEEGYHTGTPPTTPETVHVATYHITTITLNRQPGHMTITLKAQDKSSRLDDINRLQNTYYGQTIEWLINEICARAGIYHTNLPASLILSTTITTYILHSGQRYRRAIDQLCNYAGLDYALDQDEIMYFVERNDTPAAVWSYEPEIETLTLGTSEQQANYIIVIGREPTGGLLGAFTSGQAHDLTNLYAIGRERLAIIRDGQLTTANECETRAINEIAEEQHSQQHHSITVPVNPALQVLDTIEITDQSEPAGTGKTTTTRIINATVKYEARPVIFTHTLSLINET